MHSEQTTENLSVFGDFFEVPKYRIGFMLIELFPAFIKQLFSETLLFCFPKSINLVTYMR